MTIARWTRAFVVSVLLLVGVPNYCFGKAGLENRIRKEKILIGKLDLWGMQVLVLRAAEHYRIPVESLEGPLLKQ